MPIKCQRSKFLIPTRNGTEPALIAQKLPALGTRLVDPDYEGRVTAFSFPRRTSCFRESDFAITVFYVFSTPAVGENGRPFDIVVSARLKQTKPPKAKAGELLQRRMGALFPQRRKRFYEVSYQI